MLLKDFIIKSLQAHNCQADLIVLSDYIVALLENGTKIEELPDQLREFLNDKAEVFVNDLLEFKSSNSSATYDESEEVKVDYEESELATVSLKLPQRTLREYSPERKLPSSESTTTSLASTSTQTPRSACTFFMKRGHCRFGENCRYLHISRPSQSSVSTRIKLLNLPESLLNPVALTKIMSKYGNVTGASVYPEKGEASIQYARGDEAQKAYDEFEYDEDGIIIELENKQPPNVAYRNDHNNNRYPTLSAQDVKLKSLLSLQKRQQSVLESNLAIQQGLLATLQSSTALSETERLESLSTLKSIQASVLETQEMLKKTTELIINSAKGIERPTYRQNYSIPKYQPYPTQKFPQKHPMSSYKYNPNSVNNSNSLDLRPTTLKLTPLPATELKDIHSLQRHFSPYGLIQSLIITEQGQSAVIKYQKHSDALKALENAGKSFDNEGIEFSFIK